MAYAAKDGAERSRIRLEACPVFDGMAAAGGRLFIALQTGRVACLADEGGGKE